MRNSNQRTLKVKCVEIPLPISRSEQEVRVNFAYTPPLQLLSLAAVCEASNCYVEKIPADMWWPAHAASESEIYSLAAEYILSENPDLVVTVDNGFTWPIAARLLTALEQTAGQYRPRIVVGGIISSERFVTISKYRLADALFCAGEEESFEKFLVDEKQRLAGLTSRELSADRSPPIGERHNCEKTAMLGPALVSSTSQLSTWPRWEKGLANTDTCGFQLDNQAHPWNVPAVPPPSLAETAEWLRGVTTVLRTLREPVLWLSMTRDSWTRDAMELMGDFALGVLKNDGVSPSFGIRVTVNEILSPFVLGSLAMLPIRRIDLLVGSGTDSVLQRFDLQWSTQEIEQSVKEIKRSGLGAKTRLQSVIGLPEEDLNDALETVKFTARLAAENAIGETKYEWWCNIPSSMFYINILDWEQAVNENEGVWFLDEHLLDKAPSVMPRKDRRVLKESVEFLRILYAKTRVVGPSLL